MSYGRTPIVTKPTIWQDRNAGCAGCGIIVLVAAFAGYFTLCTVPRGREAPTAEPPRFGTSEPAQPTGTLYAWPGEGDAFGWLTKEELEQAQASRGGGKLPPNAMRMSSGTNVTIVERDGQATKVVLGGGPYVRQRAWVDGRDVR